MKILFIGDVVGRPGRNAVKEILPKIKKEFSPDLVIMNGENLSHGKGISESSISEMQKVGVEFFTSGNHIWSKKDIISYLEKPNTNLIRPANYPPGVPGKGYKIFETTAGKKVLIINLQGLIFMSQNLNSPFQAVDEILNQHQEKFNAIFVDFHAEATSEKVAMREHLDGRVSVLVGTHTHIPTRDAEVTELGTAYITDVGMVGKKNSIIGIDKEDIMQRFLTQMPAKHTITEGPAVFNAVLITVDENTSKATSIEPLTYFYP